MMMESKSEVNEFTLFHLLVLLGIMLVGVLAEAARCEKLEQKKHWSSEEVKKNREN